MKKSFLSKKLVVGLVILAIAGSMTPLSANAVDPSLYGGRFTANIGDTVTYKLTLVQGSANSFTPAADYLANGSMIHYNLTQGITATSKVITINKSASGVEQIYFQRTFTIPNNGTYTLSEMKSGSYGFFNYAFSSLQNASKYYVTKYNLGNSTGATTQSVSTYYHPIGSNLFFIATNSSSTSTKAFSYTAYEFNWKTGWDQSHEYYSVNGAYWIHIKWELQNSHSSPLPSLTVFSVIPPLVVLVAINIFRGRARK